jgi:hypothetical protein
MEIHRKFDSKQEYTDFFLELISWKSCNKSLWNESDLPLLKPFFVFSNSKDRKMTEEEKLSFDHYMKCDQEYGQRNSEVRNAISGINEEDLADAFCFKTVDDGLIYYISEKNEFPLFVTGYIDSDFFRSGQSSICVVRFVTLNDFE